jgi:hypothetical protein
MGRDRNASSCPSWARRGARTRDGNRAHRTGQAALPHPAGPEASWWGNRGRCGAVRQHRRTAPSRLRRRSRHGRGSASAAGAAPPAKRSKHVCRGVRPALPRAALATNVRGGKSIDRAAGNEIHAFGSGVVSDASHGPIISSRLIERSGPSMQVPITVLTLPAMCSVYAPAASPLWHCLGVGFRHCLRLS